MTIRMALTKLLTQDLLQRVVGLLSSVSGELSMEQIQTVVQAHIPEHLAFAVNNDIGLCILHLEDACGYAGISTEVAAEAAYARLRNATPATVELLATLANGIAGAFATPLYALRVQIPQEMTTLCGLIRAKQPAVEALTEKSFTLFDWGKLQHPHHRTLAIITARDKANCFKRGTIQLYDTNAVLTAVPHGTHRDLPAATLPAILTTALTSALAAEASLAPRQALLNDWLKTTVSMLTQTKATQRWLQASASQLRSVAIAQTIPSVSEEIDAVEDLLQLCSAAVIHTVAQDAQIKPETLFDNVEMLSTNIQLLRAAMVYHHDVTLVNKVVLSPHVVQAPALEAFTAAGGSEDMIRRHLAYLTLNDHLAIPRDGLSGNAILDVADGIVTRLATQTKRIQEQKAADTARALQIGVRAGLNQHYRQQLEQGRYTPHLQTLHETEEQKAIWSLNKRSLEDIALTYLVTLRNDPTTSVLYTAINNELHQLVQTQTDIQPDHTTKALCGAICQVVLDKLTAQFSPTTIA